MDLSKLLKYSGISIGFTVVSQMLYLYFKSRYKEDDTETIDVITTCDYSAECRSHDEKICDKPHCCRIGINKIVDILDSAQLSICLCMCLITSKELSSAIVRAKNRGVVVRVILDVSMSQCTGSRNNYFKNNGIEVRYNLNPDSNVHHKLCLIDTENPAEKSRFHKLATCKYEIPSQGVVITGSQNWTMQAMAGNWDYIMIISKRKMILAYQNEFDRMWMLFNPENHYKRIK